MMLPQPKSHIWVAIVLFCAFATPPGLVAQTAPGSQAQQDAGQQQSAVQEGEQKLPSEQIQSLVAPISLYPDPLLAQVLAASTYPLQIVEAAQWLNKNTSLQGSALVDAAAKKTWDPSVQALVVFPTTLKQMSDNLEWTTALGNAFLAQQAEVMNAIQALRKKAYDSKALTSNSQQKVGVDAEQGQTIVKIEPSDPQVIYVPSYDPTVVYGAAPVDYPYPAMVYPAYPTTGAAVASSLVSFGVGVAVGAAFHGCCGSGWGWGCSWGSHEINVNNTFMRSNNLNANRNVTGTRTWAHNPANRGAAPYSNAAVASRYGGTGAAARSKYGTANAGGTGAARTAGLNTPRAGGVGASGSAQRLSGGAGGLGGSAAGAGASRGGAGLEARSGAISGADRGSAFSTGGGGDWARSSSARGNSSLSSSGGRGGSRGGGGGFGGGGFRGGGGGGFRGGGRGRR